MTYKDAALDYRAKGFSPIPVHGKTPPPAGATGVGGTVTEAKIFTWMADPEWAGENVALRAEGYIAIDVDAYEDKHGDDQLAALEAALGELPATWTSTARGEGPSRQHFFTVPAGRSFISKAAPDIEIVQASHRYSVVYPSWHPKTGEQYTWYSPEEEPLNGSPSLRDFEALPAAWIEYLTVAETTDHQGFAGDIDTWLSDMEPGPATTRMLNLIDGIPEGDFGHDKMLSTAFKIVRLGAEGYTGTREGLDALYAAWLRGEYNTPENLRGINLAVQGAIKKAGARPELPDLPPFLTVANLLPASFDSKLYMDEPDIRTEQHYAAQRHALATAALTAKLDDVQTAALVWGSVVGKPLQAAPSGLRTLWAEVARAKTDLPVTSLATVTPIRPVPTFTDASIVLLSDEERVAVVGYSWFGTSYLDWVSSKPIIVNTPYHRMNRWMVLSRVFSDAAYIYKPVRPVGMNLYQFVVGDSTSGKTESFELAEQVIDAFLADQGEGGRAVLADITKVSPTQLHSKLIERDGQTSLVRTDEAQAFFSDVKGNEWQRSLIDDFAKYYDGRFAAKLMSNDKENSDKEAFGDLSVHFTGITDLVMQALELSNWQSGFLLRCVWAIGNPPASEEMSADVDDDDDAAGATEPDLMPAQFAAQFGKARRKLDGWNRGGKHVLVYTPEAKARHRAFKRDLRVALEGHPQFLAVLKDYNKRFEISINKCAGLAAASEGSQFVELRHELIAIEQSEEWLRNALIVLAKTGHTRFDRQCQELLDFVKCSPSGRVDAVDVYRKYRPAAQADALLRQLEVEQRVTSKNDVTNKRVIEIRKEAA